MLYNTQDAANLTECLNICDLRERDFTHVAGTLQSAVSRFISLF